MHTSRTGWIWDGEQWRPPNEAPRLPVQSPTTSDSGEPADSPRPIWPTSTESAEPAEPVWPPPQAFGRPSAPEPAWLGGFQEVDLTGRSVFRKTGTPNPSRSLVIAGVTGAAVVLFAISRVFFGGGGPATANGSASNPGASDGSPTHIYQPVAHDYVNAYSVTVDGKKTLTTSDLNVTNDGGSITADSTVIVSGQTIENVNTFHIDKAGWHWDEEDVMVAGFSAYCLPTGDSPVIVPASLKPGAKASATITCTATGAPPQSITRTWMFTGMTKMTVAGRSIPVAKLSVQTSAAGATPKTATEYYDIRDGLVAQTSGDISIGGKTISMTLALNQTPAPGK